MDYVRFTNPQHEYQFAFSFLFLIFLSNMELINLQILPEAFARGIKPSVLRLLSFMISANLF